MSPSLRFLTQRSWMRLFRSRASAARVVVALAAIAALGAAAFGRSESQRLAAGVPRTAGAVGAPKVTPAFSIPTGLPVRRAGGACPLNPYQERKAGDAFKKLLPVVQHPRCLNCHGGVNPFVEQSVGGHGGGAIDTTGGFTRTKASCQECHSGLPGWELPVLPEMSFVGKSPRELCILFKLMKPKPELFVGHIYNENGHGPRFTESAYKGDRALNDMAREDWEDVNRRRFVNQRPPGTHAQLVADAQAWVDAMDDGYTVKPDCGCKPHGSAWEGTVKGWWEMKTDELGTLTETSESTVRFVIDSSYDTRDDEAEYWKSVSGSIKWQTSNVGGECRVSASGSLPIGLGADLNPMATLRETQGDVSGTKFSVGIGPWPDAYVPRVLYRCPENTPTSTLLGAGYYWWLHDADAGMVSPDGERMKGSYRTSANGTVMSWEWDLHLVP